jgi:general secretion pathway protein N
MKRAVWLTVVAFVAFAAIVIARLPASWMSPSPKSDITCTDLEGTVWSATCTGLTAQHQLLGDLTWNLHPSRLLLGKLTADLVLTGPAGNGRGLVEVGLGRTLTARDVHLDLRLDPRLIAQLPPDLKGQVHADIAFLAVSDHRIRSLEGRLEAHNLTLRMGANTEDLGSFALTFPSGSTTAEPVGQLRDLGGPLEVQGGVHLTPEPGFSVQSQVRAGSSASTDLTQILRYLGSPDAQGWRLFTFSETF